ncbi:MAG TPA: ferredoxin reductase [Gemmatimonadaceae bacterium]|nr:ferredoxin reductase [Gemmatimonadaceae bacterium]
MTEESETAAASPPRLAWQVASVVETRQETPRAHTLVLDVPGWRGHRAGQHVDVRLVAEDGYQAQRSYSIASAPENPRIELTIERLDDGEVSPYLCDVLHAGDGVEVRGPIGGYFVWSSRDEGPVFLIAGGSGIVPLMAMLRHRAHAASELRSRSRMHLLYSARTVSDIIYIRELADLSNDGETRVTFTLTREPASSDWKGERRRIDRAMLEAAGWPAKEGSLSYVCGPTPFVEAAANLLVEIGYDASRIRTERFGPTS